MHDDFGDQRPECHSRGISNLDAAAASSLVTLSLTFFGYRIDHEREGGQIDRALLKKALIVFVDMGIKQMDRYEGDFEASLLEKTAAYYSKEASIWIEEDSCPDYMLKAEKYLQRQRDRVSDYLFLSTEPKLLEKVQHELLFVYANQLLDNKCFGRHAFIAQR